MEQPKQSPNEASPQGEATSQPPSSAAIAAPTTTVTPNPNQTPRPSTSQPQTRPPATAFGRPWQQSPAFPHFSSSSSSSSSSSPSSAVSPSSPSFPSVSAPQRGGMAIGVPASTTLSSPSPPSPSQPSAFPGSFGPQFGALGRGGAGAPESSSNSSISQGRPIQGMGMMGTLGSSSPMRPSGISVHQARPVQSSLRPPLSPTGQSPSNQSLQGHTHMRASPAGSSASPVPSPSQGTQSINQPWLSSGSQGKPPLPPSSYRPPMSTPSVLQRSHIPQQPPPSTTASQSQHMPSVQQQQSVPSHQPQEHQQLTALRSPQSLTNQPQISRVQGSANQKPSSVTAIQTSPAQSGTQTKMVSADSDEHDNRILSKRSIHELVCQIDQSEKLDPEVEEILVDIAEDFVESITTFGCSLAKHRKSDTLEAKDILLHLERTWHMRPPGFSGDEIKTFKKPVTTDIHKERLAAIKRSINASEAVNAKHRVGQAVINAKGSMTKTSANPLNSMNFNR